MSIRATSDQWWKNGVVYCLDVETYLDGNGDGCGDLRGLTDRVDYLAGLGVTVLWLMPFHPSPDRDDGYDVTDFYAVDPRLGTMGDFVELVRTAHQRGIRVIIDLVVNHTSDQHPWFQSARASKDSPYRDWYVWADEPTRDPSLTEVFPGDQQGVWAYDDAAGQYYLHRFYPHQPDLNVANPAVRDEIARIAGFWLELGVSGFRMDAVPFLLELNGIEEAPTVDPKEYLRDLRAFVSRRRGDAILLGEVNLPPPDQRAYFGDEDGDGLHMIFNFSVMQRIWLALARGDVACVIDALDALPTVPFDSQWASFLRNHDELTLDQLSDDERAECFAAFGPDESMQLYGRGLRRRLPTMLGGDRARIELAYSLLFCLPGTPVIFYGEEIGMGENLDVPDRGAVRTPMQWANEPGGGFSTGSPDRFPAPMPGGDYGPDRVNAAAARRQPDSLLNWMERLMRRRNETPEWGFGDWRVVKADRPSVLVHRCDWEGSTAVAVHNFADAERSVAFRLDGADDAVGLDDLLDGHRLSLDGPEVSLDLPAFGYRWYRVLRRGARITP
jgi:maltose alpha-D-glucosyltransferase/alpha-amylase